MSSILELKVIQNEVKRLRNVKEDIEGRNVEYDISMFKNMILRIGKLVNGDSHSIWVYSDMWHECNISLDKIVDYFGLRYGRIDQENFRFEIVK